MKISQKCCISTFNPFTNSVIHKEFDMVSWSSKYLQTFTFITQGNKELDESNLIKKRNVIYRLL